ncbi:hypothetical protein [Dongia sp.]|uniref:hypothetical protein n=1 Tax=Dongia sp. TaxID=1977262 RepID=UPI0035AFF61C
MSGGNPIPGWYFPGWRHALLAAICMVAAGAVQASEAQPRGTEIGIATANIAWTPPSDMAATFEEIRQSGFTSVRIGLKEPRARAYAAFAAAKQAGLGIVVTVPLIDGAVATKDATPRAKAGSFFPAYGLSQIDLERLRARIDDLLAYAADAQIDLLGIELGNEINWSGYNGDLPLVAGGNVIERADGLPNRFIAGLDLYGRAISLVRERLAADAAFKNVTLVTAGLADINAGFIKHSNATYIAPDVMEEALAARGIYQAAGAVGIHLYEPLRRANKGDRRTLIEQQLDSCGAPAFAGRPCWITEFGSALAPTACPVTDPRDDLLQPLLAHLARAGDAVPRAYYYDWNADKGFALERCGKLSDLVHDLAPTTLQ